MNNHGVTENTESPLELWASCRVRFEPSGKEIVVLAGTLLLDAARRAGMPVAQSCGGFAICSWCKMQVLEGAENLSAVESNEERLARRQSFREGERASCQAEVHGDVTVTTTYW
jgi:ferredoxin